MTTEKLYNIIVTAERETTMETLMDRNSQNHVLQLFELGYTNINISIKEKDALRITGTTET